ncbi:MAG TPA: DUF4157 domain-containing protein [Sphingomicrobium sp.]|nr:DUF4157 domain-containing protein [Sphingomicrobium sp.]
MAFGPKVTIGGVKKPRVTVGGLKKPRVTVGGDIGKLGGKITDQGKKLGHAVLKAAVAPPKAVIEVIGGKRVDQAVSEAIAAQFDPAIAAVDAAATASQLVDDLRRALLPNLGEDVEDFLADIERLSQPLPPESASALLRATQRFVETGKFNLLDPLAILVAGEIVRERNEFWERGDSIPDEVVAVLPAEFQERAAVCRKIDFAAIAGDLTLPSFAIRHLGKASAITLVDLIVLQEQPDATTADGKHYWAHELTHADQYADRGVTTFVRDYLADKLKGTDPVRIERDADLAACKYFPDAHPRYIDACPIDPPPRPKPAPKRRRREPDGPAGTQGGVH